MSALKVLAFAGSLRQGSYNRALLRAAQELAPENMEIEVFDLSGIPEFNQDQETNMPPRVVEFKNQIAAADALLIATPEHNYSVPGVLKNAIDWASRPYGNNSFNDKPVAIMSASAGFLGGARAQYHLRQSFVFLNVRTVNRPEVFVGNVRDRFDADGRLLDETSRAKIKELLEALIKLTSECRAQQ